MEVDQSLVPRKTVPLERQQELFWESAWLCLADLCDAFEDFERRSLALEYARRHNPMNIQTLHRIAKMKFKGGRFQMAADMFEFITKKNPNDGHAWLGLGHSSLMLDTPTNYTRAMSAYQSAMATLPTLEVVDLWYGIGFLYLKTRAWVMAEQSFAAAFRITNAAVVSNPALVGRLADIAYRRLFVLDASNNLPNANLLDIIEQYHPVGVPVVELLSIVSHGRLRLGDHAGAARAAAAALNDSPAYVPALLRLACAYLEMGRHIEARKLLQSVLHEDPRHAVAHYLMARSHLARREFSEAHSEFQQAILKPQSDPSDFWVSIGCLYFRLDQHREAFEATMFAMRIEPTSPRVWHNLGVLYEACGQYQEAIVAYRTALLHDRTCDSARLRLEILVPLHRASQEEQEQQQQQQQMQQDEEDRGEEKKLEGETAAAAADAVPAEQLTGGAVSAADLEASIDSAAPPVQLSDTKAASTSSSSGFKKERPEGLDNPDTPALSVPDDKSRIPLVAADPLEASLWEILTNVYVDCPAELSLWVQEPNPVLASLALLMEHEITNPGSTSGLMGGGVNGVDSQQQQQVDAAQHAAYQFEVQAAAAAAAAADQQQMQMHLQQMQQMQQQQMQEQQQEGKTEEQEVKEEDHQSAQLDGAVKSEVEGAGVGAAEAQGEDIEMDGGAPQVTVAEAGPV